MAVSDISAYLVPGSRAHLVGIGGVSMAQLAEVLQSAGLVVTGSDLRESATVQRLRSLGIPVCLGQREENLGDAQLVIYTAAARSDNPEIAGAKARGIPLFKRAEAWGCLMRGYKNALCVAGTHGKTTTTSMCTHILMAAGADPTVMIGGTLPLLGAGHRVGGGDTIVMESCEYQDSFLSFFPTIAVILNVEADHLDYFRDLAHVERSFRAFADLVPPDTGLIIANRDDPNTMFTLQGETRKVVTFGLQEGDAHAAHLTYRRGMASFDLIWRGETAAHVTLQVPGEHNVRNALAAAAAALSLGVEAKAIEEGLAAFGGAGRRFEKKGEYHGAMVYDDYAHHPSEVKALLDMAATLGYSRVICAFQPHTYSRTKALFDEFVTVLRQPDLTLLAEIYAAREKDDLGVSSRDLCAQIPGSEYYPTLTSLTARLRELARPGDLILTVGAGDIYTAGEALFTTD